MLIGFDMLVGLPILLLLNLDDTDEPGLAGCSDEPGLDDTDEPHLAGLDDTDEPASSCTT